MILSLSRNVETISRDSIEILSNTWSYTFTLIGSEAIHVVYFRLKQRVRKMKIKCNLKGLSLVSWSYFYVNYMQFKQIVVIWTEKLFSFFKFRFIWRPKFQCYFELTLHQICL